MKNLEPHKVGVALGLFIGFWHLVWSILVLLGLAQPLINFIFWAHFFQSPFTVAPFEFERAIILVVVVSLVGYIAGSVFATIWNKLHKNG